MAVLAVGCGGGGRGGGDDFGDTPGIIATREFRAIAGVSMGGYGALNLGTKRDDLFGVIASLGGPVDLQVMLRDTRRGVRVAATTAVPSTMTDPELTFDHPPPYPERDARVTMVQDLVLAFGNPLLHHPDPERQYLAIDAEPATLLADDEWGTLEAPTDRRGFLDGGDGNDNGQRETDEVPVLPTEVALLARGTAEQVAGSPGTDVGGRALVDLDGDGRYDTGDGIVVNAFESFADTDGDDVYEPEAGETFQDDGLDGAPGTGDFGEGNGVFDYDPDRARWLAEDPTSRLAARAAADIARQRIYLDVGTEDEFGFLAHYENLVAILQGKGLTVGIEDGFGGNCVDLPDPDDQFLLVRYPAGHVGFASVDPDDLFSDDPCGEATVWERIVSMIGFLEESFPDGVYVDDVFPLGATRSAIETARLHAEPPRRMRITGGRADTAVVPDRQDLDPTGDVVEATIDTPALQIAGGAIPTGDVVVYRPPAFFDADDERFPIVYFLGGYGQKPSDFERIQILLDGLVLSGQLQNMYFAFLPGAGGVEGSFYVNHVVPESQAPSVESPTSGRYEDAIFQDLIPAVEGVVVAGRVR
jgi:enterochelin esterase-like enzyme